MANGSINITTSNVYIKGNLVYQTTSNIEDNSSLVTATLYLSRTNTGYETYGSGTFDISIGDNKKSESSVYSFTYNSNTVCISHSATIPHNADGTKTINIKISGFVYAGNPNLSVSEQSFSLVLDTIARESNFTVSDGKFGVNQTLKINSASSNFTHTLEYTCLGETKTLFSKTTLKDLTFAIPVSLVNKLTNSYYTHSSLKLSTYSGNTLVGSKIKNITVFVPDTIEFSPSIENVLATVVSDYSGFSFVKNKSKVKISIVGAKGAYGSSITSYSISGHAISSSKSEDVSGVLTENGDLTYTATVKDSRGRTATKTVTITVSDYFLPKIETVTAVRCLENGNEQNDGTYAKVTAKFSYADVEGNNSITTNLIYLNNNESIGNNTAKIIGTFLLENSYPIKIEISDSLGGYDSYTASLQTADAILSVTSTGKGVAIGKYAEEDNLLDIAYNARFRKEVTFDNPQKVRQSLNITADEIGAASSSHNHSVSDITSGVLSVERGGTGATTADAARINLDVPYFDNLSRGDIEITVSNISELTTAIETVYSKMANYSVSFKVISVNGSIYIAEIGRTNQNYGYALLMQYSTNGIRMISYSKTSGAWSGGENIVQNNKVNISNQMAWKKASVAFSSAIGTMSASGVTTSSTIVATRGDSSIGGGAYQSIGAADCKTNGTITFAQNGSANNTTWTVSAWWSK